MKERVPETRVAKIINSMKRERGGTLRHNSYKERMTGKTEQWEVTQRLFDFHSRRLGFNTKENDADHLSDTPQTPTAISEPIQQTLF